MRRSLGIFPVLNRHDSVYEDAEVFSVIEEHNVQDFERLWKPELDRRLQNLGPGETAGSVNAQDAHWKWREKTKDRNQRLDFDSFVVECGGMTQGLMFVRNIEFAREKSQAGQFLIYIDLVSAAPWNRIGFTATPKYKGIGPLLFAAAISYSVDQGFDGRIGLHSLPQSETWYRDVCGMTDLGPDAAYHGNLRYFEMTPAQAQSYISTK